jgi:hypothetical protein
VLVHLLRNIDSEEAIKGVESTFLGEVVLAEDLMDISAE